MAGGGGGGRAEPAEFSGERRGCCARPGERREARREAGWGRGVRGQGRGCRGRGLRRRRRAVEGGGGGAARRRLCVSARGRARGPGRAS